jgi:hypothetical protein
MKKYVLKTSDGEVIITTHASDLFEAQEYFSSIKQLEIKDLFKIFTIEEIKS